MAQDTFLQHRNDLILLRELLLSGWIKLVRQALNRLIDTDDMVLYFKDYPDKNWRAVLAEIRETEEYKSNLPIK